MTLADFIKENGITIVADRITARPDRPAKQTPDEKRYDAQASHWVVTIRKLAENGKPLADQMSVLYSMGAAHKGKPTAADVLNNIASDVSGYDNAGNFRNWCAEYGSDTDSRAAERTYNAIGEQAEQLRAMLGSAALYRTLLSDTDRL